MSTQPKAAVVESDVDPFSEVFLSNPYPAHRLLRDTGPVVRLTRYQIWAMARHAEVAASLQDFATFCSGRGAGLSDFAREQPWRPPSIILEADPPLHTRTRAVLSKVLSRPALAGLRDTMGRQAERLLDEVLVHREFDAFTQLAEAFPLRVFPDAVGLVSEGRENLLPYGDMAFNAFGPRNALLESSMQRAAQATNWIAAQCRRESLAPEGFGAKIYAEADQGNVTEAEAGMLVRSLLTAGLDTTIHGIAHTLHCFATSPEQWQVLRKDPSLVRAAFEEVMRVASPVQTFFRTTTRTVEVSGTTIPEGEKVLLFLAAANRDPRRWDDPDRFEIRREAAGHVGFGHGIHQCVGQMLARMETEVLLTALLKRVADFEPTGPATIRLNNTLRGLQALPLRVRLLPAAPAKTALPENLYEVRVTGRKSETIDICSLELTATGNEPLPAPGAGAHIDVHIAAGLVRQYSLCNDPAAPDRYLIAVLRESKSRGGSIAIHEKVVAGSTLRISRPKNHFPLMMNAKRSLLFAGGIGVTPILAMTEELARQGADFEMHYCARSRARAAFQERLQVSSLVSKVQMHFDDGEPEQRLDLETSLAAPHPESHLYVCGPKGFIDAVLRAARLQGWQEAQLHREYFTAEVVDAEGDTAFDVRLSRSDRLVHVPRNRTVVQALRAAGISLPVSCEQGVCGTCLTTVCEGIPDHRDLYLTAEERAANNKFTPCCSRARSPVLVLDL